MVDIATSRSNCDVVEDWPSLSDIDVLCMKAAGLFIYASKVVKLVASRPQTPIQQLEQIVLLPQSTTHEGRPEVDLLYT